MEGLENFLHFSHHNLFVLHIDPRIEGSVDISFDLGGDVRLNHVAGPSVLKLGIKVIGDAQFVFEDKRPDLNPLLERYKLLQIGISLLLEFANTPILVKHLLDGLFPLLAVGLFLQ